MKKEIKKPSTAPIWGFSGMWVLWCLFGPLYHLWHFLLCVALAVAVAIICSRLFPAKTVVIEVPDPKPDTGNAELDRVLLRGQQDLQTIEEINEAIPDEKLSKQLDELASLTRKIFQEVQEAPEKLPQITICRRQFPCCRNMRNSIPVRLQARMAGRQWHRLASCWTRSLWHSESSSTLCLILM